MDFRKAGACLKSKALPTFAVSFVPAGPPILILNFDEKEKNWEPREKPFGTRQASYI